MRISDWSSDVCSSDLPMTQQMTPAAAHRVTHADFTIERVYDAAPARVYAAFADAETKQRWSFCHSDWPVEHALDFRSEERRVGTECGSRVDFGECRIIKKQT